MPPEAPPALGAPAMSEPLAPPLGLPPPVVPAWLVDAPVPELDAPDAESMAQQQHTIGLALRGTRKRTLIRWQYHFDRR